MQPPNIDKLTETLKNLNSMLQEQIERLNYTEQTLVTEVLRVANALADENFRPVYCFDHDWLIDHIHQASIDLKFLNENVYRADWTNELIIEKES